jgi:AcrR family transcriptional regulator
MPAQTSRATPLPPAQRREALIEATVPLLLEHGTDVSTRQIALACGVAEGTLFRAFGDKDSLIEAAVKRVFDPQPTLAELAAIDPSGSLEDRLIEAVEILQLRLQGIFALLGALRWTRRPEDHGAERQRADAMMVDAIVAVLADDADQLRYPAIEVASLLRLLVFAGSNPFISNGTVLSPRRVVEFALDGVRSLDSKDQPC